VKNVVQTKLSTTAIPRGPFIDLSFIPQCDDVLILLPCEVKKKLAIGDAAALWNAR
jgi:hypothetical protein